MTTRELLLSHAARYPLMQAVDYAKLLYQSAFAGGHLIASPAAALDRLKDETAHLPERAAQPLVEPIGGGLCRLNLAPARKIGLRPETICGLFVETARSFEKDADRFERGLDELAVLCRAELPDIDANEIAALRRACREQDYPPFSHSARYRAAYAPAYRLISDDLVRFLDVFAAVDGLLEKQGRARVAIDGCCAAGKSTAAALFQRVYGAQLFHMDDFFLPFERKTPERLSQPGGNVDWERFQRDVLDRLDEPAFTYRPYDCGQGGQGDAVLTERRAVQIVEGAYSLHPGMRGGYDLRVFLHIDPGTQRGRIRSRNPDKYERFVNEWIPLENRYFGAYAVVASCDIVYRL